MRAFKQGSAMRVTADERDVSDFMDRWPASGLGGLRSVSAIFERNGDLVDLYTNGRYGAGRFDGGDLSALLRDMQKYGKRRISVRQNPDLVVADEILRQLGGSNRLKAMVGAHSFRGDRNSLTFNLKARAKRGIRVIKIVLDPSDTYNVEFWSVAPVKKVAEYEDVYAEGLLQLIERETGLALRLNPVGRKTVRFTKVAPNSWVVKTPMGSMYHVTHYTSPVMARAWGGEWVAEGSVAHTKIVANSMAELRALLERH